jgi:hypothetical protein
MAFGVDTNPRFVFFSIIISAVFTYIFLKVGLLAYVFAANPIFSWIELMILFVIIFNVIYVLAAYEVNEADGINRAYIVVAIALIIAAIALNYLGPAITSILK